jgi:ketosteroid isomerase-like protein
MSVASLRRLPALATTGVGSLPFAGPADAVAHVAGAYELPFCPQLPRRDGDMLQEWLGGDPGHCGWSPDRDRERPAAWDGFVARMRRHPPAHRVVKLQVTGPVTLAIALERASGRRGSGPEARSLAAEIAVWLAAAAAGQVRELAGLGLDTLLIVDEPGLAAAGLRQPHTAIWDPLRGASAAWGLHVCGVVPWPLIDALEPDALSFDLTRGRVGRPGLLTLARILARDGRVVWGIIDPVAPGDVGEAAARMIAALGSVGEAGRPAQLAGASLISPGCGSGRLSVDSELRLAATLGAVAGVVRDQLPALSWPRAAPATGRPARSRPRPESPGGA